MKVWTMKANSKLVGRPCVRCGRSLQEGDVISIPRYMGALLHLVEGEYHTISRGKPFTEKERAVRAERFDEEYARRTNEATLAWLRLEAAETRYQDWLTNPEFAKERTVQKKVKPENACKFPPCWNAISKKLLAGGSQYCRSHQYLLGRETSK